jgi:hypothetical protein
VKKAILIIAAMSTICLGVVKTYCDKCGVIMPQEQLQKFKVTIQVGDKTQEVGCDICGKCFEKLCKEMTKYGVNVSSDGWKENNVTVSPNVVPYNQWRFQNYPLDMSW